jgi:hypothetical protein
MLDLTYPAYRTERNSDRRVGQNKKGGIQMLGLLGYGCHPAPHLSCH